MKLKIKQTFRINKIGRQALAFVTGCLYLSGCVKDAALTSPQEGTIYMPQAYLQRANLSLYYLDSPQTTHFGIAYGGFKSAPEDITANFAIDTSLIAQYNIDNAYLGVSYIAIPDSAYTVSGLTTVLKAGTTSSDTLALSLTTSKLKLGVHYLLPIKLTSISSGKLDSSLTIAYYKIDTLTIRARDITNQGSTFTFNYDDAPGRNDAGESAIHLVDSNYSTKYLLFTYHPDMYVQLAYTSPTVINAYTITSGNDSPERDPKDWNLCGSDDGVHWTVLDTQANQSFLNRTQTVQYNLKNTATYTYYRLNITANNNGNTGLFQCTEWRLLQFY